MERMCAAEKFTSCKLCHTVFSVQNIMGKKENLSLHKYFRILELMLNKVMSVHHYCSISHLWVVWVRYILRDSSRGLIYLLIVRPQLHSAVMFSLHLSWKFHVHVPFLCFKGLSMIFWANHIPGRVSVIHGKSACCFSHYSTECSC